MFAVEFLMFLIVAVIVIVTGWVIKVVFMLWDRFNKAIESFHEYQDELGETSASVRWGINFALTILCFGLIMSLYYWFVTASIDLLSRL